MVALDFAVFFPLILLVSMFAAGGKEDYCISIKNTWEASDRRFSQYVKKISSAPAREALGETTKLLGRSSIVIFAADLIHLFSNGDHSQPMLCAFLVAFLNYSALDWYVRGAWRKDTKQMALYSLVILLIPASDVFLHSDYIAQISNFICSMKIFQVDRCVFPSSFYGASAAIIAAYTLFVIISMIMMHIFMATCFIGGLLSTIFYVWALRMMQKICPKAPLKFFSLFIVAVYSVFGKYI